MLVEQIEFANVIILNKIDLISKEQLKTVKALIRGLNVKAKIIEATHSKVNMEEVIDTGLYNLEEAQSHPLWAQELYNPGEHVPETEEYGITSFVYRAKEPFDPAKIYAFFNKEWPGVVRAKGFFWLATRPDFVGEVSQAGAFVRHQGIGRWWAAVPEERWPESKEFRDAINNYWTEDYGDRRQEIVFIGIKNQMDEIAMKKELDKLLVKHYLASPEICNKLSDPFPQWFTKES